MWYGVGWGKGVGAVTRRRRIDAYGKTNKVSSKYFQCFRKPSRNSPFTDVKVTDANENVKFFYLCLKLYQLSLKTLEISY